MSLDDFARNLVFWSPQRFGIKRRVNKTLCFLGFHDDMTFLVDDYRQTFNWRTDTHWHGKVVKRILRLCGRCGSIR